MKTFCYKGNGNSMRWPVLMALLVCGLWFGACSKNQGGPQDAGTDSSGSDGDSNDGAQDASNSDGSDGISDNGAPDASNSDGSDGISDNGAPDASNSDGSDGGSQATISTLVLDLAKAELVQAVAVSPKSNKVLVVYEKKIDTFGRLYATFFDGTGFSAPTLIDSDFPSGSGFTERVTAHFLPQSEKAMVAFERVENDKVRVYGNFYDGTSFAGPSRIDPGDIPCCQPVRFYELGQFVSEKEDNGFVLMHCYPESSSIGSWIVPFDSSGIKTLIRVDPDNAAEQVTATWGLYSSSKKAIVYYWYTSEGGNMSKLRLYASLFDGTTLSPPEIIDHGQPSDDPSFPRESFSKMSDHAIIVYSNLEALTTSYAYGASFDGTQFSPAQLLADKSESAKVEFSPTTDEGMVTYKTELTSGGPGGPPTYTIKWQLFKDDAFGTPQALTKPENQSGSAEVYPRFQYAPGSNQGLMMFSTTPETDKNVLAAYWFDGSSMIDLDPPMKGFMDMGAKILHSGNTAIMVYDRISPEFSAETSAVFYNGSLFSAEKRLDPGLPSNSLNGFSILPSNVSEHALVLIPVGTGGNSSGVYVSFFNGTDFYDPQKLDSCPYAAYPIALTTVAKFMVFCVSENGVLAQLIE